MVAWPSDFVSTTRGINCCKRKKGKRERERDVTAGKNGVAAPDVSSFLATTNGHCARTKEGFPFCGGLSFLGVFQMAGQTTKKKKKEKKKGQTKKEEKRETYFLIQPGFQKDYK